MAARPGRGKGESPVERTLGSTRWAVLLMFPAMVLAGCPAPSAEPELVVGTILPLIGDLNAYGPPGQVAVNKAAEQINGAEGRTYRIRLVHEDSQTQPAAGATAATKLKNDGASAIIGAYASGVSKAVLEVAGPNGIVQVSPASTSPEFTEIMRGKDASERFFFRTSPSDALQGKVAGAYAIAKGWEKVVVLHLNNPYGNGLRATFTQAFQGAQAGAGGAQVRLVRAFPIEAQQSSYDSVLQQAFAGCTSATAPACPDGVFFIAYPDTGKVLMRDWWARSEWRAIPWLNSEGVQTQSYFDDLRGAGIRVEGMEGTAPVGVGPKFDDFKRILGAEPSLFQAHAYDAMMLVALAAEKAQSTQGQALRDAMRGVANPPGELVGPADFARAVGLLKEGRDINYEGGAGSQDLDEFGDPISSYEVYFIDAQGKIQRKCLVTDDLVTQTPVPLPAECTRGAAMPPPPPPPPPAGAADLAVSLKESGGTAPRIWSADPANATRPADQAFNIVVTSAAGNQAPHNLTLIQGTNGTKVASHEPTLNAGQSATLQVPALAAGAYTYYCAVTGHRGLGMEGTLTVA